MPGVWVAHPKAKQPLDVRIVNTSTGAAIDARQRVQPRNADGEIVIAVPVEVTVAVVQQRFGPDQFHLELDVDVEGRGGVGLADDDAERARFWAGRKAAFPAAGRISPDYYCMDGTIPRRHLARVLGEIHELSDRYGLPVVNVFHAGDGNLHPLLVYDARVPGTAERVHAAGREIVVTDGLFKRFNADDLAGRLERFSRIQDVDPNASGRWYERDKEFEYYLAVP